MRNELSPEEFALLDAAETFRELAVVALHRMGRQRSLLGLVSGPISTGGCGSPEKNLEAFHAHIRRLRARGVHLFDQSPFEDAIQRVKKGVNGDWHTLLMTTFYRPILESGLIATLYSIPGWKSSKGARFEHAEARRLGITIVPLPPLP